MEEDVNRPPAELEEMHEAKRNEALARYDAHPGIVMVVLAVMAFLFIVIVFKFASSRMDSMSDKRAEIERPAPTSR